MTTPTIEQYPLTKAPDREKIRKVGRRTITLPGTNYTFTVHGFAIDHANLVSAFRAQEFVFSWVEAGPLTEFLQQYQEAEYAIPEHYTDFQADSRYYISGVIQDAEYREEHDATHFGITDNHIEAALRIESGGGHYDANAYQLHSIRGMVFFLLTGPNGVVSISPLRCTPEAFGKQTTVEWTMD